MRTRFLLAGVFLLLPAVLSGAAPKNDCGDFYSELPLQARNFHNAFGGVQAILNSGKPASAIVDDLAQADAREKFMHLDQLIKSYRKLDPDFFGKFEKRVHDFSHELGAYVLTREMIAYGQKIGAPPEVMKLLERDERNGKKAFIDFLRKEEWIDAKPPRLDRAQEKLARVDWLGPKKEKRLLLEGYIDSLREIDDTDWDMEEFNKGGMHELRRKLREIALAFQGQRGGVALEDNPCKISTFAGLARTPIADSKYARLAHSPEYRNPIRVTRCLFLGLTQFVNDFGNIKDVGEKEEILAQKFVQLGNAEEAARQKASELAHKLPEYQDVVPAAKKLYAKLKRTGLIREIRRELKAQLEDLKEQ